MADPTTQPELIPYQNPLDARLGAEFFKQLPKLPGIYRMIGLGGNVIYVGKAKNLRARLASYRRARPHRVSRKVVRLIHSIDEIQIEVCESEMHALLRENELIREHRPLFNVVNTEPESYLFLGVKLCPSKLGPRLALTLTANPEPGPEWPRAALFGAFKGRGRVREAYQALLRMLWAAHAAKLERFEFPQPLVRYRYPREYEVRMREGIGEAQAREWLALLQRFLRGTSDQLLKHVTEALLGNLDIPPFYYRLIQDDLETLQEFYAMAPRRNRDIRVSLGLRTARIEQIELDDLLVKSKAKRGLRF
jgi:excinuclease ABC subunit C